MTQQLCPDLFREHEQMLESVAMAPLSSCNPTTEASSTKVNKTNRLVGVAICAFEQNRSRK